MKRALVLKAILLALVLLSPDIAKAGINEDLLIAARRGQVSEVRRLLSKGADVNTRDNAGFTPLWWAIEQKDIGLVGKLIDAGADVNHRGYSDNTPLYKAAAHGELGIVNALLAAGADRRLAGQNGTPIAVAAAGGYHEIVKILRTADK